MIPNRKIKQLTDQELIAKYLESNSQKYVGELFLRYNHLVFLVCLKYLKNHEDSKDAVNDIFEKLIYSIKKQPIQNFKNWLYVVTKNHCLMKIRLNKKLFIKKNPEELENLFVENQQLDHHHSKSQMAMEHLDAALLKLKKEQKRCIELFFYAKKSYKEIANETGLTEKNVKSHIQNGKRNLKNMLYSSDGTYDD